MASAPEREAAFKQQDAARKAEQERLQRMNAEFDAELAAAADDPGYWRRKRLKASIMALVSELANAGPVHRSHLYETLNGGRHKDIFSEAIQELLDAEDIIQTSRRNGTQGRIGIAYVRAPQ
jgi:hypothetical protein